MEIYILAGGLSSRMERDKSLVRLGKQTLLEHVRTTASQLDIPVRIVRRDAVPRCGPLGGIYTALKRSRADALLFLACDMPFVSESFLKRMIKTQSYGRALFAMEKDRVGFPFLLPRQAALPLVSRQIDRSEFSLQALVKILQAKTLRPPRSHQSFNINTPADLKKALSKLKTTKSAIT